LEIMGFLVVPTSFPLTEDIKANNECQPKK